MLGTAGGWAERALADTAAAGVEVSYDLFLPSRFLLHLHQASWSECRVLQTVARYRAPLPRAPDHGASHGPMTTLVPFHNAAACRTH